jgi:ATP-dependent Clp protease adaptor protein ClpS
LRRADLSKRWWADRGLLGTLFPVSQTIEKPRTSGPGSGLGGNWRVIVRNDDHNTFDGVARALSSFIPGISLSKGYAIADTIHTTGQAIVWTGQKEIAELYWEQLRDAGLTMAPLEQG